MENDHIIMTLIFQASGHCYYSQLAADVGAVKRQTEASRFKADEKQKKHGQLSSKQDENPTVRHDSLTVSHLQQAVRDEIRKNCCERTPSWFRSEMDKVVRYTMLLAVCGVSAYFVACCRLRKGSSVVCVIEWEHTVNSDCQLIQVSLSNTHTDRQTDRR